MAELTQVLTISTHTLLGERDIAVDGKHHCKCISTHTLRGERDQRESVKRQIRKISTHTLRGERDKSIESEMWNGVNFNSHAPWGA